MNYRWKIPVCWMVSAVMEIEAESLEEAEQLAEDEALPDETDYIDGSFEVNCDVSQELNEDILEIIKIDKTPDKDIPLLIGTLKTKQAQQYLENRIKGGTK